MSARSAEDDVEALFREIHHLATEEEYRWLQRYRPVIDKLKGAISGRAERRYLTAKAARRLQEPPSTAQGWAICGLASVFEDDLDDGTRFWILPDAYETVAPRAFDKALRERQAVKCLITHDRRYEIGSTTRGNLSLSTTCKGLLYENTLTVDSAIVRKALGAVWDGALAGSSFCFQLAADGSGEEYRLLPGNVVHRRILEVEKLIDVGPCERGAYASATTYTMRVDQLALSA
ncbi:MAG: HK97 family phage prohead protease [Phycisphaerae bacterium]|nr:HK97 family phage prohead protease [Phycisphaerae bacterium]